MSNKFISFPTGDEVHSLYISHSKYPKALYLTVDPKQLPDMVNKGMMSKEYRVTWRASQITH